MSLTSGHQIAFMALHDALLDAARGATTEVGHDVLAGLANAYGDAADALTRRDDEMSAMLDHNPSGFHIIRPGKSK